MFPFLESIYGNRRIVNNPLLRPIDPLPISSQVTEPIRDISAKVPLKDQFYMGETKKNPLEGLGGIMGLLLGVGGGILSNSIRMDQDRAAKREMNEAIMRAKTVEPSFYASKGGFVQGGEGAVIPVQAKKGEVAAMPTGMIVDVHADNEKHNIGKKVTDMLLAGTYIGGDKEVTKEQADKIEVVQKVSEYNEFEKGRPVESIKLSTLFGNKKKMTIANLLKATRDKYNIPQEVNDKIYNPYAEQTARENMSQREKYVSAIMRLDMGKKSLVEQLKMMKDAK